MKYYTTPNVLNEIKNEMSKALVESALNSGDLEIYSENLDKEIEEVETKAEETGDIHKLSKEDIEIVACGLKLKRKGTIVKIVTEDFSIQNIASFFNIEIVDFSGEKITARIEWIKYCPSCKKTYSKKDIKECLDCLEDLKLKPRKIKKIRK